MIRLTLLVFLLMTNLLVSAQDDNVKIDSLLKAYVSLNKFNGTLMIAKKSKKSYEKSYGYSNTINNERISSKSIFPIASLTKPFTALLVLKLIEENKIAIDDTIGIFFKNYPMGNKITIKHLLTHTSGTYEILRNPHYYEKLNTNEKFNSTELISFFNDKPLDFEPGTKFSYSNSGYDLLGMIIEKVTGKSYENCLKKYILTPLKMTNTGVNYNLVKQGKNKVTGYSYLSNSKQIEANLWNPNLLFSSGGLYSSISDLLKLYNGLKTNKIISKKTFGLATTPFLGGYGFGWFIDTIGSDKIINHGGNIEGFTSYFLMNEENDICIILLNNITSSSLERIGNSVYKIITNKPYTIPKPKQAIQLKQEILLSYVNKYVVSKNYIANITLENGILFLQINNDQKLKLLPEKENVFFIKGEDMEIEFISKENIVLQLKIKQGLSTKIGDKIQ